MKRKLIIAGAGVLVLSATLVWLSRPSRPSAGPEFSPADFPRLREVVRQAVWRKALAGSALNAVEASPQWLRRLSSSHIRQLNVGPAGTVMVMVQSSSGTDFRETPFSAALSNSAGLNLRR